MRFYRVELTDKNGTVRLPSSLSGGGIQLGLTSLLPNGQPNPAALDIEFDIPVAAFHQPAGYGYLKIWGLSIADIGSAYDLNGASVAFYGGMSKGLPLANPSQARLLMKGQILQAFGNWILTEQSVDMIFAPGGGTPDAPQNFVLNWTAGETLASALSGALSTGLPRAQKQVIQISDRLVLNHDQPAFFGTLEALSTWVNVFSKSVITDPGYPGVVVSYDGDQTVTASDWSIPASATVQIAPQDLIGQPTWLSPQTIQMKTVLRGDINISDTVYLPPTLVSVSAAAQFNQNYTRQKGLSFSGNFRVIGIHHWGHFRQNDAASWASTFDLALLPAA